jgi:hypothetical protein
MARQISPTSKRDSNLYLTPVSLHIIAVRRALLFAAALISLVVPMAIAAWRGDAELSLARSSPLELSAGGVPSISFSTPGPDIIR